MNNAESFVRILFHGLFIIARHMTATPQRWEIGLPEAGNHTFSILLRKIDSTGATTQTDVLGTPNLVTIQPTSPSAPTLFSDGSIVRADDTGNVEHHLWLIDMENHEFHNTRLHKKNGGVYKHKLYIEGGLLYTHAKTMERYKRFEVPNQDIRILGRLGAVAGIEITRASATRVTINDGSASPVVLNQQAGVRYEFVCKFLPPPAAASMSSHFPHYYNVLDENAGGNGRRFNVVHVDETVPPRTHDEADAEAREPHKGGAHEREVLPLDKVPRAVEPQVCNGVFLGQETDGLPMS